MLLEIMEVHMIDRLLNDREVAEQLGVSKATVWRHAASGLLPRPVKLGHSSRWPESDLAEAVNRLKAERDNGIA